MEHKSWARWPKSYTIRTNEKMITAINERADKLEMSASEFVREAVEEKLAKTLRK